LASESEPSSRTDVAAPTSRGTCASANDPTPTCPSAGALRCALTSPTADQIA
jgi:hypothetical protein